MAYVGELVKMSNGRWARFTRLKIANAGHPDSDQETTILVAVELDTANQDLLREAEEALETYRRRAEERDLEEEELPQYSEAYEPAAVH
jgi:hypothetical protein